MPIARTNLFRRTLLATSALLLATSWWAGPSSAEESDTGPIPSGSAAVVAPPGSGEAVAPPGSGEAVAPTGSDDEVPGSFVEWSVQPSGPNGPVAKRDYFILSAAPGDEIVDWVSVFNYSDVPLTFDVYPSDAIITDDNSFSLLSADQTPLDVGSWVGFDQDTVTVEAGEGLNIPFKLTVPENATPGDHAGGIIASLGVRTESDGEGGTVLVDRRIAARIYLRVDGPITPTLEVSDIRVDHVSGSNPFISGTAVLNYTITNSGNVQMGGSAVAEVTGPFGWFGRTSVLTEVPRMIPGQTVSITQEVGGVMAFGPLDATVTLQPILVPEGGGPAEAPIVTTGSAWAAGVIFWIVVGLVVLLLLFIAYKIYRRLNRRTPEPVDGSADAAAAAAAAAAPPLEDAVVSAGGGSADAANGRADGPETRS